MYALYNKNEILRGYFSKESFATKKSNESDTIAFIPALTVALQNNMNMPKYDLGIAA